MLPKHVKQCHHCSHGTPTVHAYHLTILLWYFPCFTESCGGNLETYELCTSEHHSHTAFIVYECQQFQLELGTVPVFCWGCRCWIIFDAFYRLIWILHSTTWDEYDATSCYPFKSLCDFIPCCTKKKWNFSFWPPFSSLRCSVTPHLLLRQPRYQRVRAGSPIPFVYSFRAGMICCCKQHIRDSQMTTLWKAGNEGSRWTSHVFVGFFGAKRIVRSGEGNLVSLCTAFCFKY